MKVQEALEILHGETREDALYQYDREDRPYILARAERMAIKALEEVEQYRVLGTVEELKEAKEKQVAVEHHHTRVDNITDKVRKSICPKCLGMIYTYREEYPNYCTNCGQALDWEEGGTSD